MCDGVGVGVSMCAELNITQFTLLFIGLLFGCLTFIGKVFRNNSGSMCARFYIDPPPALIVFIISTDNCREMIFLWLRHLCCCSVLCLGIQMHYVWEACKQYDVSACVYVNHSNWSNGCLRLAIVKMRAQTTVSANMKMFRFFTVKNVFSVFLYSYSSLLLLTFVVLLGFYSSFFCSFSSFIQQNSCNIWHFTLNIINFYRFIDSSRHMYSFAWIKLNPFRSFWLSGAKEITFLSHTIFTLCVRNTAYIFLHFVLCVLHWWSRQWFAV